MTVPPGPADPPVPEDGEVVGDPEAPGLVDVPVEAPAEVPAEPPAEVPDEPPAEIPAEAPAKAPAEPPAEIPAEAPTEIPAEAPTEAPAEPPAEIPAEAPTEAPAEPPAEIPAEAPTEIPAELPPEIPSETPAQIPFEAPADVPSAPELPAPPSTPDEAPAEIPGDPEIHASSTPDDRPSEHSLELPTAASTGALETPEGEVAGEAAGGDAVAADEPAAPTTPRGPDVASESAAPAEGPAVAAAPAPPVPKPSAIPLPRPPARPSVPKPTALPSPVDPVVAEPPLVSDPTQWGRVDDDGTVYVRTADGERAVGSWPEGEHADALTFYGRRFDALVVEVELLERRVKSGVARHDEAATAITHTRSHVEDAQAVGDLAALAARLDALDTLIAEQRAARRAERAKAQEAARVEKEAIAVEAEALATGDDWRAGADRLRALLDRWKTLPRLERKTDDALWHRFSTARTTYTRRRRTHFAEQAGQRDEAKRRKQAILTEAEGMSESTEWAPTAARFRALMNDWKAAGPAPRPDEEVLWRRFRAAQDSFFESRSRVFAERDRSEVENQAQKEALLAEAERLLPITDLSAAKATLRGIHERWLAVGHVPRTAISRLEGALRKIEDAVRGAEQAEWQRTSPEALARAEATVSQLEASVAQLEAQVAKANDRGDAKAAAAAQESLDARRSWLDEAQKTLADFRR